MLGKIAGVAIVALLQLIGWILLLSLGFWILKQYVVIDFLDPAYWQDAKSMRSNPLSKFIFEELRIGCVLFHFLLFFLASFFFYGAIFSVLGSRSSADSDGQQFLIPLLLVIVLGLVAGVFYILYPAAALSKVLSYLPFTSPVIALIQLAQGPSLEVYMQLVLSWVLLVVLSFALLWLAGRWYKKTILKF
jgi:ABC-2 type transport system permease protein